MLRIMKQSAELLCGPTEQQIDEMMSVILSTPYDGVGVYDMDKTERVLESCVKRGHNSVLEHICISLNCLTTIQTYKDYTRHRHCAFTIESTSFKNYKDEQACIFTQQPSRKELEQIEQLHELYCARQNARYARDLLIQCTAARMIMTTNVREWRHIIAVRGDPRENPQTSELRDLIWVCLHRAYPKLFPLVKDDPFVIFNAWGPPGVPCTLR